MFKINKKRMIFLTIATILPVGMFMVQTASENTIKSRTFETMATPVDSKTIVIDAGHQTRAMSATEPIELGSY